ncbi:MAG: gluconate:H+ symporter [Bacteroidota bacterium]
MPLVIVITGVVLLLLLIALFRVNAFIAFVLVALGVGLAQGMSVLDAVQAIQNGIGGTLGFIVLILGFGAMLGKLVAESGAAQRITDSLVKLFGIKRIQFALMLTGFIVGIPMFYSVGFIILVPLVFTIAASTRLPLIYVALPMLSALSVTHGYLPPHPAPTAIAADFNADIGLTMMYGLIVAVPAILLAGLVFSRTLKDMNPTPPKDLFETKIFTEEEMPSVATSILTALLPIILIGGKTILMNYVTPGTTTAEVLEFFGNPILAMLISVCVAVYFLGLRRGRKMENIMNSLVESVKSITMIMLIIAGAGALKQVMADSGISDYVGSLLSASSWSPIFLAWGIAALIRVSVGSATIAGLTTAGIILPMVATSGVKPELLVLATGAGSLMLSHVNDSGFWMFKEFFNLSIKETFRSWTVMESIVSVVGLIGVYILHLVIS